MSKTWSRHRTEEMDERDRKICELYEKNFTLKEIGDIYGLSKQRVHQIISKEEKTSDSEELS